MQTLRTFAELTAGDVMTRNVITLPHEMSARDAAGILLENDIRGAPVVNHEGKLVGIFSTLDFLRIAVKRRNAASWGSPRRPAACTFQEKRARPNGNDMIACLLPLGACAIQRSVIGSGDEHTVICSDPHCVFADWQFVRFEDHAQDPVSLYMTTGSVWATAGSSIRVLAQMMVDAHIHRIVVVDEMQRPIGIVSSTDVLAAVANPDTERTGP